MSTVVSDVTLSAIRRMKKTYTPEGVCRAELEGIVRKYGDTYPCLREICEAFLADDD